MYRILIVEDTQKIATNIQLYLERRGYKVSVGLTGEEALALLQKKVFDIAVLDIMLPGIDGYELCAYIRERTQTGVIMASAKSTSQDTVVGLDGGADDYIAKPFELAELEARIRSLLRRVRPPQQIILGNVCIDIVKHTASVDAQEQDFTAKQWELLAYFCENQGIFISRTDLIEHMWGDDNVFANDEKLDVYISVLRKKLGKEMIETRRGFGYRLVK